MKAIGADLTAVFEGEGINVMILNRYQKLEGIRKKMNKLADKERTIDFHLINRDPQ
jgi:hypothetical protein